MKNSADQGGFIHRGRRPRWITPSKICRILHIVQKPNSIIALLFIQNITPFLKEFTILLFVFLLTKNNTILSPGFLSERFNNLQEAALLTSFWRCRFNSLQRAALLTSFWRCQFNNLQKAALLMSFWHCWFNNLQLAALLTSSVQYDKDSFQMWSTAAGYGELCLWL